MRKLISFVVAGISLTLVLGCNAPDADVTESDVEKNRREFSQESYEEAMKASGKGAELEAEKKRNEEYLKSQGGGQ